MNPTVPTSRRNIHSRRRQFSLRGAVARDIPGLAALFAQAQVPISTQELHERVELIEHYHSGIVLVAVGDDESVLAFLYVAAVHMLDAPPQAQIGGLVVGAAARGERIGSALLAGAEIWARDHALREMIVHSRVISDATEAFFFSRGFAYARKNQQLSKPIG